jgi:hypothetical protein
VAGLEGSATAGAAGAGGGGGIPNLSFALPVGAGSGVSTHRPVVVECGSDSSSGGPNSVGGSDIHTRIGDEGGSVASIFLLWQNCELLQAGSPLIVQLLIGFWMHC